MAAQHLGRFSGSYLNSQEVPADFWLTQDKDLIREWEQWVIDFDAWAKLDSLRTQNDLVRHGWPDEMFADMFRLWQERDRFFHALEQLPKILIHNDSGKKNLLARCGTSGRDETVAVDWALVGIGSMGEEIAPLICATLMGSGIELTLASELEEVVFTGYLQGLRDAGWTGDAKLARLGYLASVTLRFGLMTTWYPELFILSRNESLTEERVDHLIAIRHFVLARADEARTLLATL